MHYEKDEAAALAQEKVNGMLLEGKKVYVGPFLRRSERASDSEASFTNVFVKNLDEGEEWGWGGVEGGGWREGRRPARRRHSEKSATLPEGSGSGSGGALA